MANVDIGVRTAQTGNGAVSSAPQVKGGSAASTAASHTSANTGSTHPQKSSAIDDPRLKKLLEGGGEAPAQITSRNLKINIDDQSGMFVVSVRDAKTDELIRQIPQDSVLHMAQTITKILDESQGSLLNEKT